MWTLALAALLASGTHPNRIEIDGHVLEVRVKGRSVTVADKAAVMKRSPEQGVRMRRAVIALTGCQIEDAYWEAARLKGLLKCP
jgi:hypothetical protein